MAAKVQIQAEFDGKDAEQGLNKLGKSVEHLEDSGKKGAEGLNAAQAATITLNQGVQLLQTGVEMAGKVFDATIGQAVEYAEKVRDLGRESGMSADETSRLIQVSDDLKVEYGTLEQVVKNFADKGLTLSIEKVAQLSDEYLSLQTQAERNKFAEENLGRAWKESTKLLEAGGQAIRDMAAAQSGALILSEADLKATRDLEIAKDALDDEVKALSISFGTKFIPVAREVIKLLDLIAFGGKNTKAELEQQEKQIAQTADGYDDFVKKVIALRAATYTADMGLQYLNKQLQNGKMSVDDVAKAYGLMTDKELANYIYKAELAAKATEGNTTASKGLAEVLQAEEGAWMDTGSAAKKYTTAAEDAKKASSDLQGDMQELTKAMIFNQLAANLDTESARALAEAMGLIIPDTVTARALIESMTASMGSGTYVAGAYEQAVRALGKSIADLKDRHITITLTTLNTAYTADDEGRYAESHPNVKPKSYYDPSADPTTKSGTFTPPVGGYYNPNNDPTLFAVGGGYTVPPGYNENWPVGPSMTASSGEKVNITRPGQDLIDYDKLGRVIVEAFMRVYG